MLSNLVIAYLFVGGAGAGSLALLCALEYVRAPLTYVHDVILPDEFFERAWLVCLVSLAFSVTFLVADLGYANRIALLLIPTLTPISIGAWALGLALLVAGGFAARTYHSRNGLGRSTWAMPERFSAIRVVCIFGIVLAFVVITYTGVMLSSMPSVLAWQTPLVPLLFIVSSLSCGFALLFVALSFTNPRKPVIQQLMAGLRIDSILIMLELALLIAYLVWCLAQSATVEAGQALLFKQLAPAFWIVLVGIGLCTPLLLERFVNQGNYRTQCAWMASCLLAGGLALRWCVAELAAYDASMAFGVMAPMI